MIELILLIMQNNQDQVIILLRLFFTIIWLFGDIFIVHLR